MRSVRFDWADNNGKKVLVVFRLCFSWISQRRHFMASDSRFESRRFKNKNDCSIYGFSTSNFWINHVTISQGQGPKERSDVCGNRILILNYCAKKILLVSSSLWGPAAFPFVLVIRISKRYLLTSLSFVFIIL